MSARQIPLSISFQRSQEMSHGSKREVAPAAPQALPPGVPLWGGAAKPDIPFQPPGEAMALPPGWWTAPPPQSTFVSPYGAGRWLLAFV
ncbi:unnamed protein product [Urochloa humidicola]